MNAKTSKFSRSAGLMAGTFLALASVYAAPEAPATADKDTNFEFDGNFIKVAFEPTATSGSSSSFEANTQKSRTGANGIEQLRFSSDLGKEAKLDFDGHALTGTNDYLAVLKLNKEDLGKVEFGFKRFRTFYDGIGGFFPTNGAWKPLEDQSLHVDRQKMWVDMEFSSGDSPVFHVKYWNEKRTGQKDTTVWGNTDFTGIAIPSNNSSIANRNIVGSYMDLDDLQHNLEASIKKTFGNTTIEAGYIGSLIDNVDSRYVNRYPGELRPWPAIPSTPVTIIPPEKANNPVYGFDVQKVESTTSSFYAKFESVFNDKVTLFGGAKYETSDGEISGDRQMMSTLATTTGPKTAVGLINTGGRPPYSYVSKTAGMMDYENTSANIGLHLKPVRDLFATVALKTEHLLVKGQNDVNYFSNFVTQATGVVKPVTTFAENWNRLDEKAVVPQVDFRYSGIRSLTLYGNFDYRHVPSADEKASNTTVSPGGAAGLNAGHISVQENHGNYKLGASWAAHSLVVVRGEVFSKSHSNGFYDVDADGSFVLNYNTKGGTVSVAVTPIPTVTSTTKLTAVRGEGETAVDSGAWYQCNDTDTNLISETIDWAPTKDFYIQANLHVAFDSTITAYPRAGGLANRVTNNADNNYWTGSAIFGMVIDKNTDGQVQYSCYHANNWNPQMVAGTVPYGMGQDDYSLTVGVKHKFSERLIGEAKFGYYESNSDTTGGYTDYTGTVGYVSLAYAF